MQEEGMTPEINETGKERGRGDRDPNCSAKWEEKFQQWSQSLDRDEQGKLEEKIHILREYIFDTASSFHQKHLDIQNIQVSPQGSYSSGTSTRGSDIDIGIRLWESSHSFPKEKCKTLKEAAEELLISLFGKENVEKSPWGYFKVYEDDSGICVEVLPAIVSRRDTGHLEQKWVTDDDEILADPFEKVDINRENKHQETGRRFRKVVRIFKNLLEEMRGSNSEQYTNISSHLLECMVYNTPIPCFGHQKMTDDIRSILEYCIIHTRNDEACKGWKRLDELNYVFFGSRCWKREEVHTFLANAWDYVGFENHQCTSGVLLE